MAMSFTKTLQLQTRTIVPDIDALRRLAEVLERIDRAMRSIRGQAQTMPRPTMAGGRPPGWSGAMGMTGVSGVVGQFATGGLDAVLRGMVERGAAARGTLAAGGAVGAEAGLMARIHPYVAGAMAFAQVGQMISDKIRDAMRWMMRLAAMAYITFRAIQLLTGIFDRLGQAILRGVVEPTAKAVASLVQLGGVLQRQQSALATVFGPAGGTAALDWLTQIAYSLPQTLEDTSQAMIKLGAMGVDKMTDVRRAFMAAADMATIFGTDVERAATAIAKVGAGQMSSLTRTYGIRARDIEEYGGHLRKGTEQLDSSTWQHRVDNLNALLTFIERNYGGAAQRMAGGLQNVVSNLQDFWTQLANAVKAFQGVDRVAGAIKTFIDALRGGGEGLNIRVWGEQIAGAIGALAPAAATLMQYVVPLANSVIGMLAQLAPMLSDFVVNNAPKFMQVAAGIIAATPKVVAAYLSFISGVIDKGPALAQGLGALATVVGQVIDMLLKLAPVIAAVVTGMLATQMPKLAALGALAGVSPGEMWGMFRSVVGALGALAGQARAWGETGPGARWAASINDAIVTALAGYYTGMPTQGSSDEYLRSIMGHQYNALGRMTAVQEEGTDAQQESAAELGTQTGYLASMDQALSGINTYYRTQGALEGGAWAKNRLLLFGNEGAAPFSRGGMVTHSLQYQLAARQLDGSFVLGATLLYQAIVNGVRDAARSSQLNWVPYMSRAMAS